jgi:hypothetical protein
LLIRNNEGRNFDFYYDKKFKELYGESEEFETPGNIVPIEEFNSEIEKAAYEVFMECESAIDEANGSSSETALKNKAKKWQHI